MTDASTFGLAVPDAKPAQSGGVTASTFGLVDPSAPREQVTAGPQPSFLQGVGAGLADKFYAAAQLGARMPISPEQPLLPDGGALPAEYAQSVDKTVQQREQRLQEQGYNKGWGRTVGGLAGDIALTAPLSVLGPEAAGAGWLARAGQGFAAGAEGGAISGLTTPVTTDNFETGKIGQVARGATEGGLGGAVLGAASKALAFGLPEEAEAFIKNAYTKAVRPSVQGKSSFSQQAEAYDRARLAIDKIVELKPTLALTDHETGEEIVGKLPQSIAQFGQAIDQAKRSIFARYDVLAKQADIATTGRITTVPRFQQEFAVASQAQTNAAHSVRDAERKVLLAAAQQARAGQNVYLSSSANQARAAANKELGAARSALDKAQVTKAAAYKKLGGVWVDLQPTIRELRAVGSSTLKQVDPKTVEFANGLADRLAEKAAFSPSEAQEAIQHYNARLGNFYKQPTRDGTSEAAIEAMVANKLREGTDKAINEVTGRDYQDLKNAYGALRSIEKDVVHRALVQGRNVKGGLTGMLFDVATADQVIHAITRLDPTALASAAGWQTFKAVRERLLSPNRAVRRMFDTAERLKKPDSASVRPAMSYALRKVIPPAGAALGYQTPQHSALGIQ